MSLEADDDTTDGIASIRAEAIAAITSSGPGRVRPLPDAVTHFGPRVPYRVKEPRASRGGGVDEAGDRRA